MENLETDLSEVEFSSLTERTVGLEVEQGTGR